MLGSDKSRAYCLEMICADFLAGVSLEAGNRDALLPCLTRLVTTSRSWLVPRTPHEHFVS
jgi:hypothetical protein